MIRPAAFRPLTRLPLASTSARVARRYASHGEPPPNEPTGYLFGEIPPPHGHKRISEGWEWIFYLGFGGCMATLLIGYQFRPNNKSGEIYFRLTKLIPFSISDWAEKEARRRMEERGDLPKYEPTKLETRPYKD